MAEVVLRRGGFAGFRFGTRAVLRIALICGDLRFSRHTSRVSLAGARGAQLRIGQDVEAMGNGDFRKVVIGVGPGYKPSLEARL